MAKVILMGGTVFDLEVHRYNGACFKGQATCYVFHPYTNETVWVKNCDNYCWFEVNDTLGDLLREKFPEEVATEDDHETIVLRLLDRLHRLEN